MLNIKQLVVRILLVMVFVIGAKTIANAQSTVYVFMRSTTSFGSGGYTKLTLNGTETFDLRGPLKSVRGNVANPSLPLHMYQASKKKLVIKEEGKVLLGIDYECVLGTGKVSNLTGEIQLNLSEGSVHYVKIGMKGLNDIQFTEIKEKDAKKLMNDKKYAALPDYVEE